MRKNVPGVCFLLVACATAQPGSIGYVKTKPDLEPVAYTSMRPLRLSLADKIPDEYTLNTVYLDNGTKLFQWRTTIGEGLADIFRPHFADLTIGSEDTRGGAQIKVTKAEFVHEQSGYVLSYRILILKDTQELFRIEGRAQGGMQWQGDALSTVHGALETALRNMQRDIYNKLFVSAEGKTFRNSLK